MRGRVGRTDVADSGTGTSVAMVPAYVERGERGLSVDPGTFGAEHMRIVKNAYAPGASDPEFAVLWAGAKARGLDPVRKQIYFVSRYDDQKRKDVWASQVSIDGFRSIAETTGKYDGQDEPEFEYDKAGKIALARVRVYRKDIGRAFVGVAWWSEYVQTKSIANGGGPTHMWSKMSHAMLAKCAEALALRKAFPEQLAGLYTGDEMAQADNEPSAPHPEPPARAVVVEPPSLTLQAARVAWEAGTASEEQIAALAASTDANDRANVFEWRIGLADTIATLDVIVCDIAGDKCEPMRMDMMGLADRRRLGLEPGSDT